MAESTRSSLRQGTGSDQSWTNGGLAPYSGGSEEGRKGHDARFQRPFEKSFRRACHQRLGRSQTHRANQVRLLKAYADTSFLVCLYVSEAERSPIAVRYMQRQAEALPFTPWHRLEFRNAIRARVREKLLSEREQIFAQLERDLNEEVFLLHQRLDWTDCLRAAEGLGTTHAERCNIRASDLFQVACAFELGLSEFLTFDANQGALAQAAGLRTPL